MKLAIISDLHVGHRMYRTDENGYNKFEQLGYKALAKNIDIIVKEKPDLVINAGDIFETANPSILAMNKYFQSQQILISNNIPTMTILGNHDFAFNNRRNHCSAAEMVNHTYFADYEIKPVEIDGILFIMMPYIYDTDDNIAKYLKTCKDLAKESECEKKILITHGVTEQYYKNSLISDKIMLSDGLVELFDLVIIGHIHTPFDYYQNKTLVLSPGSMIDYQAYEDRTGPIILDTDTMKWNKIKVKTPHIIKKKCTEKNINEVLNKVSEDIYHISFEGNPDVIDNDIFIKAKNIAVQISIDVINPIEETQKNEHKSILNFYDWINANYPQYIDDFNNMKVREADG